MFQIHVFEFDHERARRMSAACDCSPLVQVHAPMQLMWTSPDIDALYVSLPAAERWGAKPVTDEVQVLQSTDEEVSAGQAEYILAGLAFSRPPPDLQPEELMRLVLAKVREAIARSGRSGTITRVGFPGPLLGLDRLSPSEGANLLCKVAQGLNSSVLK